MPHMMPQIVKQKWVEIDGPEGIEWLPLDLWGEQELKNILAEIHAKKTNNKLAQKLLEMTRNQTFFESKVIEGFGARLSAPGYLDCTDWCVFISETEARKYIEERYDICSYCGTPDSEEGYTSCPECNNKYGIL